MLKKTVQKLHVSPVYLLNLLKKKKKSAASEMTGKHSGTLF